MGQYQHAPGMAPQYPQYGSPQYAPNPGMPYYPPHPEMTQYAPAPGMYSHHTPPGTQPGAGVHPGTGKMHGGMSQFVDEIANGGSGFSSLGKMVNLDDSEFWKGALIGAAAVLLLTNESVQKTLFKTGVKAKDAVKSGVEKVKAKAREAQEESGEES